MKQNILRTISAVALAIVSMGAWADRVVIAEMQNGTIMVGNVSDTGEQTVILTVAPNEKYYIEVTDIVVSKTTNVAQARQQTPGYSDLLTVTAVSVDGRGAGTYQFTLPEDYGAYVKATFTACLPITPTVTIIGWTYGAYDPTINSPKVTGNTGNGAETFTYAAKGSDVFTADVPVNVGDYTVKASIAAAGHYLAGEAIADFAITEAAMEITATGYEGIYDGQAHGISVTAPEGATVKYGEMADGCTFDASPTYINAGSYTVYYEVTKENYTTVTGSQEVKISAKALEDAMIAFIADQTFTGSELTPVVSVTDGNTILAEGTDYTLSYADNVNVGTATVIVTGMGNYSGIASATFTIVADKAALNEAIAAATEYYNSIKDTYADIAAKLKEAIDAAQAVADKADATQEETDVAIPVLNAAVQTTRDAVAAEVQLEVDKQNFADYKTEQQAVADALAEEGDSEACQQLITDAKVAINALAYDEGKTFDENKAAVDAIIEKLKNDLTAQRAADAAASIVSINGGNVKTDIWYDMHGRKLKGMLTKSGVYILNGKKIIIR